MLANEFGIGEVSHFLPLHYLPYIARSMELLSKPALRAAGFNETHFRSKSRTHDIARGFGEFAFLTLDKKARIVCAKLMAGFPHVALAVPSDWIDHHDYLLCRFNVAMTRKLRREGKPGFPASESNGRYLQGMQIPVAETIQDKRVLLRTHYTKGTMIEVLVRERLPLPSTCAVVAFHKDDLVIVDEILKATNSSWASRLSAAPSDYNRANAHVQAVKGYVQQVIANPDWRGNGLEFDKL